MVYKWETLGPKQESPPSDLSGKFKLSAPPECDIWRSKPEHNVFDAPAIITRLKARDFQSVSVTVTADWKTQYDQAGLLLVFPGKSDVEPKDSKSWIKAGVEMFDGEPKLGVVGVYAYSDWSLAPRLEASNAASFKFVRQGKALWIYTVHKGKDVALREITWAFLEDRDDDAEIWVGVYTAKPTPDDSDEQAKLEVTFENFKVESS